MSGISSSVGLFSGIDTASLIQQLLAVQGRPKQLIQRRVIQLQGQQTALLDLRTKATTLKTLAAAFNTKKTFQASAATSSNPEALTAAAQPGAAPGAYAFLVDRVVSTRQLLSRGFSDRDATGVGATSFTFEPEAGRLDRDTPLDQLNGGAGVSRGRLIITNSAGTGTTVDLSRAATIGEVLAKINSAGAGVTASVSDHRLVITDAVGGTGTMTIASAVGDTTAASLGIAGSAAGPGAASLTGAAIYTLGGSTALASLNDGNGVRTNSAAGSSTPDFTITTRDGVTHSIDIGAMYAADGSVTAAAVANVQGVIDRIAAQTAGAVTAAVGADGRSLTLTDTTGGAGNFIVQNASGSTAASDLGLAADVASATITGRRLLAGLNSTLASNLLGGSGLADGAFSITARDGTVHSFTVPTGSSVSDILAAFSAGTGGLITAGLDATGTGLVLTDHTASPTGNLIVAGAGAIALGLDTDPAGVAASTLASDRLQHRYIAASTALASLNGGAGIGTGSFEVTDSTGVSATVSVTASHRTIGDVIDLINSRPTRVRARVNDRGDGILLYEDAAGAGSFKIRVRDTSGAAGKALNLVGEAAGTGAQNTIDGSMERTVAFSAGDTLQGVMQKINDAKVGVTASIISDGSASTPFRLALTSARTGTAGRFTLDTAGLDLNLQTISEGQDARLFYGSGDAARAVLLSSTTNLFDGIVPGVSITATAPAEDPVTVSVTRDLAAIETAVKEFVAGFNDLVARIGALSVYDAESQRKGPLFGDSTAQQLRSELFGVIQSRAIGVAGAYQSLFDVGLKITSGGQIEIQTDELRAAIDADPQAVADLFAAKIRADHPEYIEVAPGISVLNTDPEAFTSLGVVEQVAQLAERYVTTAGGVFKQRTDALDTQIKAQQARIKELDARLEQRRVVLERQFLAMERAIGGLQSQQGALGLIRPLR
ncbi:MAG TPA: flagellar filament capping protein FliD [Phycisphaerales bacterium]|nr:flagellar filament capping protein FliD [Phycisphaerales bacterium]